MRGARADEKHARFVKQGVRDFQKQEVRRHCVMIHGMYGRNCKCLRGFDHAGGGKISSYVYEEARMEEASARKSRKLALEARDFKSQARDTVLVRCAYDRTRTKIRVRVYAYGSRSTRTITRTINFCKPG